MRRRILLIALATCVALALAELGVRLVAPQQYMYPRGRIAPEYGFTLFPSTEVAHEKPGHWSFVYTHNQYGYRGRAIPISNTYARNNIVVLGDSNSYGMGVSDGDEYPAVMDRKLSDHDVVNLSVWGYGLSQQVRRFYEFGILYQPATVVLQFCSNDPGDNCTYDVCYIQGRRILFRNSGHGTSWLKKRLSASLIQKSQLYNLLRGFAFNVARARSEHNASQSHDGMRHAADKHVDLLLAFAQDLRRRGVRLLMISVNHQLDDWPTIAAAVADLDRRGVLDYVEVTPWFDDLGDVADYRSPQGHIWGKAAHHRIGTRLAELLQEP